ncbi:MAG: adenylate/guanylate cyclase domain-containing protein [Pseudomonadota bacterium]
MAELSFSAFFRSDPPGISRDSAGVPANRYAEEALARHKREGLELAVRTRTIAMLIIAATVTMLTPWPEVLYYLVLIGLFILIGFAQRRVGRVGLSRAELVLLFCDLALMTLIAAVPNPFATQDYPAPFHYQFAIHKYFFVILATATLAYSWRTIFAVGVWTSALWAVAAIGIWLTAGDYPEIRQATQALYADAPLLAEFMDPSRIVWDQRFQEIIVFLMCAGILTVSVRRLYNLVLDQASAERARANLSRYFSPNVVERLSVNDEPLRQVRGQEVAVLFVDIVGFTSYAASRPPERVIDTLREFHALLEAEVFRHYGTLDKYLGDGLMATFGTPTTGPRDAADALACARSMADRVDAWNAERVARGSVPMRASFGVHVGPVVLGDIGANRLEFAVIGNTVNVANRLEAMTRRLDVRIVASQDLMDRARAQEPENKLFQGFEDSGAHDVRGLNAPIQVWTFR